MENIVRELHKPARKTYPRRRVIIRGLDDLWQADLVDMKQYSRENNGFKYILMVIDTYSKFAWALPVKTKTGREVALAFEQLLQTGTNRQPKNLQTDHGGEFYNRFFKTVMEQYGINHYSTFTHLKASIVERLNRTIKNKMWMQFNLRGSYRWLDILPQIIDEYNRTTHRTIKKKPIDVRDNELLKTVYNRIKTIDPRKQKFNINDSVRISKYKTAFEKSYMPNWSTEIFTVSKVQRTNPRTYLLKDGKGEEIAGSFYSEELQKSAEPDVYLIERVIRRRKNKALVKWLGFTSRHNSWVNAADLVYNRARKPQTHQ